MSEDQINYSKINDHPKEAVQLFKIMMRLEFAVKEIGFCRAGNNQTAEVDWDEYTKERLGAAFFAAIKETGKASTLTRHPPQRQIVRDEGYLSWAATGEVSNVQELIGSLRRVRNNLFHGGKSGDPDRGRNDELVNNALFVVEAILQEDDELRTIFEGGF